MAARSRKGEKEREGRGREREDIGRVSTVRRKIKQMQKDVVLTEKGKTT